MDYDEIYDESDDLKLIEAQSVLACKLMEYTQLPVALMVGSQDHLGFSIYIDAPREGFGNKEEVYNRIARLYEIEIDEDGCFYSEVNKAISAELDELYEA